MSAAPLKSSGTSSAATPGAFGEQLQILSSLAQVRSTLPGFLDFPPFSLPPLRRLVLALINRITARQRQAVIHTVQLLEWELQGLQAAEQRMQSQLQQLEQQLRTQQASFQSRLTHLADRVAGMDMGQRRSQVANAGEISPPADAGFDQFYAAFEAAFRGDSALVLQRQAEYLPLLKAVLSSGAAILDIGCGRGEWLQLMAQQGYSATGWDINARFIEDNRARGLSVHHGDALAEVARIAREAPGTLNLITAFHVVEHIPFSALLALLDDALVALADGGVLIFETPNPENLVVGANTFHTDPTHQHPVHPATLVFAAERAGFAEAQAWRLLTARGMKALALPADPVLAGVVDLLNRHLACGPDFALVARKGCVLPVGVQP